MSDTLESRAREALLQWRDGPDFTTESLVAAFAAFAASEVKLAAEAHAAALREAEARGRARALELISATKHYHDNLRACEIINGNDARAECHLIAFGSFADLERRLREEPTP